MTRRKKHKPEQIVSKLRAADMVLNSGKAWQLCWVEAGLD